MFLLSSANPVIIGQISEHRLLINLTGVNFYSLHPNRYWTRWPELKLYGYFRRLFINVSFSYFITEGAVKWLVIFPMPGNNSFETQNFADPRFSFGNNQGASLSPECSFEKNYCEIWNKWFRILFPKRFYLFPPFGRRKIKEQIAARRKFLDI